MGAYLSLCFRSIKLANEIVLHWTVHHGQLKFAIRMFMIITHIEEYRMLQQQNRFPRVTRVDFALPNAEAGRVSSRTVHVFRPYHLHTCGPYTKLSFLMVFLGNGMRGSTGQMIIGPMFYVFTQFLIKIKQFWLNTKT